MTQTKEELKEAIQKLEEEKEELENQTTNDSYDEMLDEDKTSWIDNYDGGQVMRDTDPIGYRCGLVDFNDARLNEIEEEITNYKMDLEDDENKKEERVNKIMDNITDGDNLEIIRNALTNYDEV